MSKAYKSNLSLEQYKLIGFDAGKKTKGRKGFMTVDTLGLVLRVLVTAANVGEREGGKQVLKRVKQSHQKISLLTQKIADCRGKKSRLNSVQAPPLVGGINLKSTISYHNAA
ncbi:transposase [Nostoc sphaeroides CCNUC1]|uniref:Transposase n=1 Tax=Nostoc sphaeroides CCNUC1 TaxID=2653204 RepID=A0A5P8W0U1_9NOSO|nr:transposase [Nostoc sphaeroides CCNUC1]